MKKQMDCFKKHRIRSAVAAALAIAVLLTGCAPLQKAEKQISAAASSAVSSRASSALASLLDSSRASSKAASSAASKTSSLAARKTVVSVTSKKTDVRPIQRIDTALPSKTIAKKELAVSPVMSQTYAQVEQSGAYQNLSGPEKELYALIKSSVYQIATRPISGGYYPIGQIWTSQRLSEAQIRVTLNAFMDDNPQVFWLANAYTYGYNGNTTIVQLFSVLSVTDTEAALSQLDSTVSSVIQSMPSGLSEFDREEYLFNYVTAHCSYDNAAVTDTSRWQAFTSYGALTGGLAVCEGYAKAMQLLAGYAGLTCTVVHGTSQGVGHMWNAIVIGGKWYNLDVTWCDNTVLIYNYYNIPDSVLKLTHTIGAKASSLTDAQICADDAQYNVFLPACTSMDQNYFRVKGISVSSQKASSDSSIIQSLAADMKTGRTSLPFYIDGTPYATQVSAIMSAKMYQWLTGAASQAGLTLDTGDLNYVTDQSDSGLTLHVSYH